MVEIIKKTLLAGLGAAVITKEKVEAALDELVKQGKVSSADARAMAEKLSADGKKEFENLAAELNRNIAEFVGKFDRKTQDRLAALEARVASLEIAAAAAKTPKETTSA